jgi:hypothetical protein
LERCDRADAASAETHKSRFYKKKGKVVRNPGIAQQKVLSPVQTAVLAAFELSWVELNKLSDRTNPRTQHPTRSTIPPTAPTAPAKFFPNLAKLRSSSIWCGLSRCFISIPWETVWSSNTQKSLFRLDMIIPLCPFHPVFSSLTIIRIPGANRSGGVEEWGSGGI